MHRHFYAAGGLQDRNAAPFVLARCWPTMPADERPGTLAHVWSIAEWPEGALGAALWVTMFRRVGFVSETGEPAPVAPLQLYRGATWGRRRGLAWSTSPDVARWFADRATRFGLVGHVFGAVVPPAGVLAYIDKSRGASEREVIVDPAYLPPIGRAAIIPPAL